MPISLLVFAFCCHYFLSHNQLFSIFIILPTEFAVSCSERMVLLYCGLNLLFRVSNRQSTLLHCSYFSCARDFRNCMACLPSQFLIVFTLCLLFALYVWNMLFTSNLKFVRFVYMFVALMSKADSFSAGLPILSLAIGLLLGLVPTSALVTDIACSATTVYMAACIIALVVFLLSAIFCF